MVDFDKDTIKQHTIRNFIVTSAFCMAATSAFAQEQAKSSTPEDSIPDKHKTTLVHDVNVGFDNLSALVVDEKTTTFYNNITPYINASVEDAKGNKASFSALELLIYDEETKTINPILSTFMVELGKELKNGGELFLRAGRENTQGGDVFPNSINYCAESDVVSFGNGAEVLELGYKKNGSYTKLGLIQDKGNGKYIIFPNTQATDFWGKGHLSLLTKSGIRIEIEAATRLGTHQQLGIISTGITSGGFGAKALLERDFKNNDNKALVRIYQNLNNGSKVISELVHAGKGQGLDLRLGYGTKGFQVFAQYNTNDKKPRFGASYSFGHKKTISKRGARE